MFDCVNEIVYMEQVCNEEREIEARVAQLGHKMTKMGAGTLLDYPHDIS